MTALRADNDRIVSRMAPLQRGTIDPMTTTPSHFTSEAIIVAHLEATRCRPLPLAPVL